MNEGAWLSDTDTQPMLEFVKGRTTDRKLRLFAVACCRRLLRAVRVDLRDARAVEVAERYADGESTAGELEAAARYVPGPPSARRTAAFACRDAASLDAGAVVADCAAGNAAWAAGEHAASLVGATNDSPAFAAGRAAELLAQAALLRDILGPVPFRPFQIDPAWRTPTVLCLATALYEERRFDDMPMLADALEEAGCQDETILAHCRGPGPHARGCWVVDALLRKE
jgi:hypothetical protein